MMKINLSVVVVLILLLNACDDFLNRPPLDSISSESYWQTSNDLKLYMNQFYPSFPNDTRNNSDLIDCNSDNCIETSYDDLLGGTRTVPSNSNNWSSTWSEIRSINYFLTNYDNVDAAESQIGQYVGEAYFFRAYFYFQLLQDYGDIPWINKPLDQDSEELYMARTPRNTVADSILADMDRAISRLSDKDEFSGLRLNKQVALLFKSRVALFEGTWEKYHAGTSFGVEGNDGTKYLESARDAAKELIDEGLYEIYSDENDLMKNYYRLFGQNDYSNNSEVMLWKKWDSSVGMDRWQPSIWGMGRGVTKDLVDSYLSIDGKPISQSQLYQGDNTLIDVVKNRDPRLEQSIYVPGDPLNIKAGTANDTTFFDRPDINQSGTYLCTTGYQLKKHSNRWGEHLKEGYYQSEIGSIIFRYAEALLNYAEAKAELGTINQSDIDLTINKLRDRVGMPHLQLNNITSDPDWHYPSLSPIINEIRRERRIELAFEGLRIYDILRWRAHHLIVNERLLGAKFNQSKFPNMEIGSDIFLNDEGYIDPYQNSLPTGYGFKPSRDYLYPIPTEELSLNEDNEQNPGW